MKNEKGAVLTSSAHRLGGMRRPLPFALLVLSGVILDQLAKVLIFRWIQVNESVPLWDGVFRITAVYNPGVAFSLFKDYPWLVLAFACIAVPALAYWYARTWRHAPAALVWSQGLLLAGATGNLLDRIRPPYMVRDFIEFVPRVPWVGKWGIFNVADICICVGVGFYLLAELRGSSARKEEVVESPSENKTTSHHGDTETRRKD